MSGLPIAAALAEKAYKLYKLPDGTWAAIVTASHLGHHAATADSYSLMGFASSIFSAVKQSMGWGLAPDISQKIALYFMPPMAKTAILVAYYVGGVVEIYDNPLSSRALFATRKLDPRVTRTTLVAKAAAMIFRPYKTSADYFTSSCGDAVAAEQKEDQEAKWLDPASAMVMVEDYAAPTSPVVGDFSPA